MKNKCISLLLAFFVVFIGNVSAAKNSDTTRIYKKIVTNSEFASKLYSVLPLYSEMGVTKESVNNCLREMAGRVLDYAYEEFEQGLLTKQNIGERFQVYLADSVQLMDSVYISMMLDSFPEETIQTMLEGHVPPEFKELYQLLAKEAYYIFGFSDKNTGMIFDDMQGYEWSFTAVEYLFDEDIINGTGDFTFEPASMVTREQFVKMICGAFDIQKGADIVNFSDVSETDWFYPYVMKMASNGLVTGISDTLFGTGNNIKRQDMAVLIYRIGRNMGYFSSESSKNPFVDQLSISGYAVTAVNTLRNNGVINGDDKNMFNPHSGASRAEAAQMIYNFYMYAQNLN